MASVAVAKGGLRENETDDRDEEELCHIDDAFLRIS